MLTEGARASGSLVEPFRHALPLPTAYYVVHPASAGLQPSARALKEWLLATSAARGK
jgi:LysR family glycine cleavage system transcriptional activator